MPAISKAKLYDVIVNPFNGKLGSLDNEYVPTVKWIESGCTSLTVKGNGTTGTNGESGWTAGLQGTVARNGKDSLGDAYAAYQLNMRGFSGPLTATIDVYNYVRNESPMCVNSEDYRGTGNPIRITALGLWIRYIGNLDFLSGTITVKVGSVPGVHNESSEYDTYNEMLSMKNIMMRSKWGVYQYNAKEFIDGKKKYFASVPMSMTLAKTLAPAFYGSADYQANNPVG